MAALATTILGSCEGNAFLIPLTSPTTPGTPPHFVLAPRPATVHGSYAIVDLRRVLKPPIAPFITLEVPGLFNAHMIQDLLGTVTQHLHTIAATFVDGEPLTHGSSVAGNACTVTLLGPVSFRPSQPVHREPAVLNTSLALADRPGFLNFRGFTTWGSTTTTTTSALSCGLNVGSTTTTTFPDAVTTPTTTADVLNERGQALASAAATNPELLDFLRDEQAIRRIAPTELPKAYTLFDGVLQTRLAAKEPTWGVSECLQDARRHFMHLGNDAQLVLIRDHVEGLPEPQIAAIPAAAASRARVLPVDARPAGRGICVLDAPFAATPFSAAYLASGS